MNRGTFTGRLGRDPEMKFTDAGKEMTKFSIAIDSGFGKDKITYWVNCTTWGKTAAACNEYLHKGSKVLVEGVLTIRTWTNKEKVEKTSLDLNVKEVEFLDPKPKSDTPAEKESDEIAEPKVESAATIVDEIPF